MIWHKQQLFLKVDAAQVGLGWEENQLSHATATVSTTIITLGTYDSSV